MHGLFFCVIMFYMEFIKIARRRSFFSGFMHVLLNILLVIFIWLSLIVTSSPYIAVLLVFLSKWRVFAVRPRFWAANIKSNLVDLVVCLSLTILIWLSSTGFSIVQALIAIVYATWLVLIKPRSGKVFTEVQSLMAVFVGFCALFSISYNWPLFIIVICAWVIGYSSLRHIMSDSESENLEIYSMIWGLLLSELSWIFSHWVVGYSVLNSNSLIIPQVSIVVTTLSFLLFSVFYAKENDGKIKFYEIVLPTIFSVSVIFVLMVFFSGIPNI